MNDTVLGYTATATWRTEPGENPELTVNDPAGQPVAIFPLPAGRPSTAALDDWLSTVGYTRESAWASTPQGAVTDVALVRPEGREQR